MWNLRSNIDLRGQPLLQKQSFHTLPLVAGLTSLPILTDKKFTNPNFVNSNNPSVLGYPAVEPVLPNIIHGPIKVSVIEKPQLHENFSGPTCENPVQNGKINFEEVVKVKSMGRDINEGVSAEVVETVLTQPDIEPAPMCVTSRKRSRKNKRSRRRQREGGKMPGKHCKNLQKDHKHSKDMENEHIIKESMLPVEMEKRSQSITSVEVYGLPKCSSSLKLGDFIMKGLPEECESCEAEDRFGDIELTAARKEIAEVKKEDVEIDVETRNERIEGRNEEIDETGDTHPEIYGECTDLDEVDDAGWFTVSLSPRRPLRSRQISVAESEDSFIVFGSETDQQCDFSEISDDETEEMNFEEESEESDSNVTSSSSVIPFKKVRFADDSELCEVHTMVKWSYAYQAARRGPWEEYARDRERFKMRINNTEPDISRVLRREHRDRIYTQRFIKPPHIDVSMDV